MTSPSSPASLAPLQQVYLLDRDAGLLCRILGLYSARGLDLARADYTYAAQNVMRLQVSVLAESPDALGDTLRVLVEKASTFVGVIAAAELAESLRRAA